MLDEDLEREKKKKVQLGGHTNTIDNLNGKSDKDHGVKMSLVRKSVSRLKCWMNKQSAQLM